MVVVARVQNARRKKRRVLDVDVDGDVDSPWGLGFGVWVACG